MKGDFSRDTFDPQKHFSAVLMQQGRVQVDADWNEQQAIYHNRIHTEAIDVIGKCGTPKYDAGFEIEAADSEFTISAGRFYVGGILCQNEAEVLYSEQPDLVDPTSLTDLLANARAGIIYLDVWQRHLTALDVPEIKEVALGKPDTTTRLKTIWQVKVLPISADIPFDEITCVRKLEEWQELIAPSSGTLNARTAELQEDDNPCLIPPNAGYLRLENQLYRVEIHQGSDTEQPSFKWSRDNGSVVTEIKAADGAEVTVADLGADEVLGFAKGQWVEVIDDALELDRLPGEILQIVDLTSNADGFPIVVLASAPSLFSEEFKPELHPQLRRWDQDSEAIAIEDGWFDLEGGIQVQFSEGTYHTGDYWLIPARTATGQIEWSVTDDEPAVPISQPPQGIKHYYCRLAIARLGEVDADGNPLGLEILEQCDHLFPPLTEIDPQGREGCCTIVVQPGEDIQQAIDFLPQTGGCVCLKTGTHKIREPILINKSNVVLKGESPGTRVLRENGSQLLIVNSLIQSTISNIAIEQILFQVSEADPIIEASRSQISNIPQSMLLRINNCNNIRVQHCRFKVDEAKSDRANTTLPIVSAIGIVIVNSSQVVLQENTLYLTVVGILAERCTNCNFSHNQLIGAVYQLNDVIRISFSYAGILLNAYSNKNLSSADDRCIISHNKIQHFMLGIVASQDRCGIINNQILRPISPQLSLEDLGGQYFSDNEPYVFGIIVFGAYCTIADNYIELNSPSYGGIRSFASYSEIKNNLLKSDLNRDLLKDSSQLPLAMFLGRVEPDLDRTFDRSVVRGNKLIGTLTGIGAANADRITLADNQIEIAELAKARAIAFALTNTNYTTVSNNQIGGAGIGVYLLGNTPIEGNRNRVLANQISDGNYGIAILAETAVEVTGNQIENMTVAGIAAANLFESAYLAHNRLDRCGYQSLTSEFGSSATTNSTTGAGIYIVSIAGSLTIESCQVKNTGISRDGQSNLNSIFWGIAIGRVISCQITHNQVFYSDIARLQQMNPQQGHRALLVWGWSNDNDNTRYPQLGNALVTNNIFQGIGIPHLVEFLQDANLPQTGFSEVNFSHNQCFHLRTLSPNSPTAIGSNNLNLANSTVRTWGRQLTITGNQVKADNTSFPSIDLARPERATLISNTTSGAMINLGSNIKPSNPEDFNFYLST